MTKKLTETFVQFTFPADLREIFAEAEVSRIVFDRQKLRLDIYLELSRVIRPSYIEQLAKSLTAHLGYSVRLWETYRLDADLSAVGGQLILLFGKRRPVFGQYAAFVAGQNQR